ncbi:adenylate/guanylate cyclase domain-containing protein [Denitrobaculum tricleocarpae]|uniref:adenylate/guanylate cyclase domain-containing protein n=1 Tax=Denitrobaculum tricleocarpae TaxID=2591009 RepID=UPI001C5525F0|nr:adenylate/guanylate cyclase domain-containing protein [Denitrobaculum tricleocarpae]
MRITQWLRKSGEPELPERVSQAIRDQEDATERLIGWVQLSVVLVFGMLYFLSPKVFAEDAEFAPVPWALSIYLLLTIIRIVWAHRARLPSWSLAVSVFFDMTLLMVLIWSFHLQYEQPASFYLKAPTLLYVFIFIALRALRFEARFVLLAGLVAAAGWGILILYVIEVDPTDTMITRDYVQYMTSNTILLGAEFDKIISILLVSVILAVALRRGRALLVRSVSEGLAAKELSRFFAPEIAAKITATDQGVAAGTGEMRQAAIVNLDMRGFTRMASQAEPSVVMGVLAEYQQRMVPLIQKHGGSIDKFMGDGIMATFGASRPSQTFAADAMRALDDVGAAAQRWHAERGAAGEYCPEINGSVATGQILFGAVGDETRLEYTVIGDAVNLSAKLEKYNKQAGTRIVADAETYRLALEQGYVPALEKRTLPEVEVDGISRPLDLVVVSD